MANRGFPEAPPDMPDENGGGRTHRVAIARVLNAALRGGLNVTGSVTLTPSATTTTLIDNRLGAFSFVQLMPLTAHAAAALAGVYFTGQKRGQVTINHPSSVNTDQNFTFLICG